MACPAIANAQSFRCRSELINVGDTKAAVLLKCGEPMTRDAFCKPVNARRRGDPEVVPCETVEEWTYDPGYGQFLTTLRFESGRLQAISYGERSR